MLIRVFTEREIELKLFYENQYNMKIKGHKTRNMHNSYPDLSEIHFIK
jgi:hypothetical protein